MRILSFIERVTLTTLLLSSLGCLPHSAGGKSSVADLASVDTSPPPPPCPDGVTITPAVPSSVQQGIAAAFKAKCVGIVIPAGTYRLAPAGDRWHLGFGDLANFDIDARGVTFILTDPTKGGVWFWNSKNTTFRGATIIHEPPPFTQGTIEAIGADGTTLDIRIAVGYPEPISAPTGYLFDPVSHQWKSGGPDLYAKGAIKLAPGLFRLSYDHNIVPPGTPIVVGDLIAFRGTFGQDVYVGHSEGMIIKNITVQNGGGFGFHDDNGNGGNSYLYNKLTYGPPPAGATATPLISANADAFHSSSVRKGPTLVGNLFEGNCDDGIPIHGTYCLVVAASADKLTTTDCKLIAGDHLRLYGKDGNLIGDAVALKIVPGAKLAPLKVSHWKAFAKAAGQNLTEVTLDKSLAAEFDALIVNLNAIGSGFVVKNNTIKNHRARGMLLKADNGLVEGNTIDGSTIAGIVLSSELSWNEADYSHNVIIRNNTIRHTGYAMVGPGTSQGGALSITDGGEGGTVPGHQNITLEGNTFENNDGTNLFISLAKDVTVKGNRFLHAQYNVTNRGKSFLDPTALIWVDKSTHISFSGNTVSDRGPAGQELLHAATSASQIDVAADGLKVVP